MINLKMNAISSLVPNSSFNINTDGSIYSSYPAVNSLTEEEIQTEMDRLQAEYDAQEYARNRASAFPSIGDQLDMQYWDQVNGTTTWKDAIAKVKSDNPKE